MDWHPIVGIAAGLVQVAAMVPYILSILWRKTKPNIVSWSIWTVVVLITLFGQIASGASWSIMILISATLQNVIVLCLCLSGYGYRKFGRVDQVCLALAVAAIILWIATANPLAAIILAVSADGIGYIPTYVKTYRDPASEQYLFWGALVVADVLAAVSVTKPDLANLFFPVVFGLSNLAVFSLAFFGRRRVE